MKKETVTNWKFYLRILLLVVILYAFYVAGFPLHFIILLGAVILFLILLRGAVYKKLNNFLSKKIPSLSKLNSGVKKVIILLAFILIYMILKWSIFWVLGLFGVNVQQMVLDGINQSIN